MELSKIDSVFEELEREVSRLKSVGELVQEINVLTNSFSSTDRNLQSIRESLPPAIAEISKNIVFFNSMVHKQKEEYLSFLNSLHVSQNEWNDSQEKLLSTWLERQSQFLQKIHTDLLVEIKRANEHANDISRLLEQQSGKLDFLKDQLSNDFLRIEREASIKHDALLSIINSQKEKGSTRFSITTTLLAIIICLLGYSIFIAK